MKKDFFSPSLLSMSMYFLDDDAPVKHDERHERRIFLMQLLFAHTFEDQEQAEQCINPEVIEEADAELLEAIKLAAPSIDQEIASHAPERPLSEINRVDLAIMRLIIFESRSEETPKKVLVDEAVELAKEFGSETSASFVNGVLGKILFKNEKDDSTKKDTKEIKERSE